MFDKTIESQIKDAKKIVDSLGSLSDKEKEIVFGKMVDKILDRSQIENNLNPIIKTDKEKDSKPAKSYNIQELYHEYRPKTNLDIIMLIAYYYHLEKKSFGARDLLDEYKLLLIPAPANISDLINKNRKKGFLMLHSKDEEKRTVFTITR